jgi:hypothetical protein
MLGLGPRFSGRLVFTCGDSFANICRNSHGMGRHMPGCDSLTGGASREFCRIRLSFASRRMGAKRELAYLCHSQLQLSLCPSPDRFYRLARAIIIRTLFFKNREDSLGFLCRSERKQPMIARVTRHRSIIPGFWRCFLFHGSCYTFPSRVHRFRTG